MDKLVAGESSSNPGILVGGWIRQSVCHWALTFTATDTDTSSITSLLSRRVFIKACMWHELAVVFHSRQAAQATLSWRHFAGDQQVAVEAVRKVWKELDGRLESMPVE